MECKIGSGQAHPEIHILDRAKCGLVAGQKMLIPTLADIETALSRLPRSVVTNEKAFRAVVARPFGADGCCTFATNKALRGLASIALQALDAGISQQDVCPFWRVIAPGSPMALRLQVPSDKLESLIANDAC